MKIASFKIFVYKIPMVKPLTMKGLETTHREGLFIRLTDENSNYGWGEISPLAGFSPEQPEDIIEQARTLKYNLTGAYVPEHLEELSGGFERWLRELNLSASARFGMEMAVLNLIACSRDSLLKDILSDKSSDSVSINALLSGSYDYVVEKAEEVTQAGYKTVKLKVGRKSIDDDIVLTKKVRETIGDRGVLRLDANRAWTMDDAVAFAKGVKDCNIDYIEEPLAKPGEIAEFYGRTGLHPALDESLRESTPEEINIPEGTSALILKPTLQGGFEISMRFARRALRNNLKCVISSSFETPPGLHALAHLAAALGAPDTAHGLGTAGRFDSDVSAFPFNIENGVLKIYPVNLSIPPIQTKYLKDLNDD